MRAPAPAPGVRRWRLPERPPYGGEAGEVPAKTGRGIGHRPERGHIGYGETRSWSHRCDGLVGEGADRRTLGFELAAQRPGAGDVGGAFLAGGCADDQVAFGPRGVDLERADQAADVRAAFVAVGKIRETSVEVVVLGQRGVADGRRLLLDQIVDPLHLST